jgi:heptosyltransferase-2
MVMAQSLFKVLKQNQPALEITVLAPAWSRALLERMPEVDHNLESPFRHGELSLAARYRFARQLRTRFDQAIVLPNSFKSALIPLFAGIPRRVGWQGEMRGLLLTDSRRLDPRCYPLMVQRFVALGLPPGAPLPSCPGPRLRVDRRQAELTAQQLGLDAGQRILAICPGAEFGDAKQWPLEHYARLCDMAVAAAWQVWLLGSANDREAAASVITRLEPVTGKSCFNLTGQTTLEQVIDLLSLAGGMVSNDSGLMHIGAAVATPLVALYGSTSPDFTPPLADRVKSLTTDISCRPCFKRQCPLGHKRCLTEISPNQVLASLNDLLSN